MGGLRFIFINNLLCQEIDAFIYGYDYLIIDKWVLPVIDEAIAAHFVDKEDVE